MITKIACDAHTQKWGVALPLSKKIQLHSTCPLREDIFLQRNSWFHSGGLGTLTWPVCNMLTNTQFHFLSLKNISCIYTWQIIRQSFDYFVILKGATSITGLTWSLQSQVSTILQAWRVKLVWHKSVPQYSLLGKACERICSTFKHRGR